jgi:ribosome modulation factor
VKRDRVYRQYEHGIGGRTTGRIADMRFDELCPFEQSYQRESEAGKIFDFDYEIGCDKSCESIHKNRQYQKRKYVKTMKLKN